MSIIIDQLRISDDVQRMYINVHVNTASYFDNVYLDSITIATADKVLEAYGDAHTDPTVIATDYIYHLDFDDNTKEAALVLDKKAFDEAFSGIGNATATLAYNKPNLSSTLFFVYFKIKGTPDECTPCRLDEEVTLAVTFDENMLYQMVMQYTKALNDDCNIPKGMIDLMLLWYLFKAAIETEHYIPAIEAWNKLFGSGNSPAVVYGTKGCGCHG